MLPNDNTNTQGGEKETGNSRGEPQSTKTNKEERTKQIKANIEEIWKEINKDVEELRKDPRDTRRKRWDPSLRFGGNGAGETKTDKQSQSKKDDDRMEKVEDPTEKILGIMEEFKPTRDKDDDKGNKAHERLKAVVTNTIRCINTLGSTVAGTLSNVFPPASSCFNAISFVLQFWLNYVKMLEKLETLMTKCDDFIGRLHIYDFSTDTNDIIELQYIAAKLMGNLVKVLRFSVKFSMSRWKEVTKMSFLDDSKIDQLIGEMSSLVKREHRLLATLSYKDITNIRQVTAQQQVAADAKAWRIAISRTLGFADDEPKRLWQNKLEEIRSSLIPNTGNWVTKTDQFKEWVAAPDNPSTGTNVKKPYLIIEGAETSGKSYLMANIVNHLDRTQPGHAVVYYFHDRGADRQMIESQTTSLVLKCLLWQCATSPVLMKSMAAECQRIGYNPNVNDTWDQLFLQNRIDTMKVHIYILVDGVEDGLENVIQVLEKLVRKLPGTFSILIATRGSYAKRKLSKDLFNLLTLSSEVQSGTNTDIDSYIQQRLENMSAFKESTNPKAAEYKEKIEKTIRKRTKGDFTWMAIIFERLYDKHYVADIDGILNNIHQPRKQQISSEIERLNRSLHQEEIKDINVVILWVITSQVTPTLDDMSAVLSLSSQNESLMTLRHRLNPLLQANESDRIEFRLDEIKKQILNNSNPSGTQISVDTRSSLGTPSSSQLAMADVETVHLFLKHVSPRKDYDKNALESVLWGDSLNTRETTISYDEQNAHLNMALTCLQVFTSESSKYTEQLLPYAGKYLIYHLSEAKPSRTDIGLKAELGRLLPRLFKTPHCIDTMFWTRAGYMSHPTWLETEGTYLKRNRKRWLYKSLGVDEVFKWFSDSTTRGGVSEPDKDWVNKLINKENAGRRREILLQDVAEQLATHLFLKETYNSREQLTAVYFLSGYIALIGNEKGVEQKDHDRLGWKEFCRIMDWATRSPKVGNEDDKKSWSWKIQVARTIFTVCKYDEDATKEAKGLLKEVQEIDGKPWEASLLACQTIAEDLQLKESYLEAQEILEHATKNVLKLSSKPDPLLTAIALLDLGNLYWRKSDDGKDQPDRAISSYRESLKFDVTRYARYVDVVCKYSQAGLHSHIMDLVGDLTKDREFDKVYLNRLVYEFLAEDNFQRSILSAKKQDNWYEVVERTFRKAIETSKESHVEKFHILKAYGDILHQCGDSKREDDAVRQRESALECGKPLAKATGVISWADMYSVIDPLAYIYLGRAVKALGEAKAVDKSHTISPTSVAYGSANQQLDLIKELEQPTDIWMNTTLICCMARYHMVAGDPTAAKSAVSKVIAFSIGILSDNVETNDWFAYLQLGRIMEALQDEDNSREAWNRLKSLVTPKASLSYWILCDECKKSFSISEELHVFLQYFGLKYFHEECQPKTPEPQEGASRMYRVVTIPPSAGHLDNTTPEHKPENETPLSDWKAKLQLKYVHQNDVEVITQLTFSIPPPAATPGDPISDVRSSPENSPEMRSVPSREPPRGGSPNSRRSPQSRVIGQRRRLPKSRRSPQRSIVQRRRSKSPRRGMNSVDQRKRSKSAS